MNLNASDFLMPVNAILTVYIMIFVVYKLFKFSFSKHMLLVSGLFVALLCFQLLRQTLNWRGSESILIATGQSLIPIAGGYVLAWLRRGAEKEEAEKDVATK